MYAHNQESQRSQLQGSYRTKHQQQRWSDAGLNRQEFHGAAPPPIPHGTLQGGRGLPAAPPGMISHERQHAIDIHHQSIHNLQPIFHRHGQHHHQISGHSNSRNNGCQAAPLPALLHPPRPIRGNQNKIHSSNSGVQKSYPHSSVFSSDKGHSIYSNTATVKSEEKQMSIHTQATIPQTKNSANQMHISNPLQPVDSNCRPVRNQSETLTTGTKKSMTPIRNENASYAARAKFSAMSPITMCFNQMLGAAEMIKTPADQKTLDRLVVKSLDLKPSVLVPEVESVFHTNEESIPAISNKSKRPLITRSKIPDCDRECDTVTEAQNLEGTNPFDELAEDEELERLVVLQMAMQRHQTGGVPGQDDDDLIFGKETSPEDSPKRPVSPIISEGFFWRDYPACEQVLYKHMERYYEVSAIERNYKVQQSFNNVLVREVRSAAEGSGFSFEESFDDKKLRDRIRCFYKTHLQNAKKRLATLQKHPDSLENRCLVAVYIRCVRDRNLSFQDSLAMAPQFPKKRRRMDKVEKLKFDLAASDSNFAAKIMSKKGQSTSVSQKHIEPGSM